ncbi:hypothetical protein AAC387_Pa07g2099 [Persea americana]
MDTSPVTLPVTPMSGRNPLKPENISDEEWIPESHLMPVIWYNPFRPKGSWSDDDEDQEAAQIAVNTAQTNALVDPNQVEPQGADEEKDLAPMPDLEEYARILQRLAIEQEQDRINQLHQNPEPEVPENPQASPPNLPNLCQADTQQVWPALTPLETPADVEDPASATFVVPKTSAEDKPIFFHRSDASSSNCLLEPFQNEGIPQLSLYSPTAQTIMKKMGYDAQNPIGLGGGRGILTPLEPTLTKSQLEDWKLHRRIDKSSYGMGYDPDTPMRQLTQRLQSRFVDQASTSHVDEDTDLPGYLFEELPDRDPGSSSNWYDFSDDEEELFDDTDSRLSNSEEPLFPKEVPYFNPVSAGDWDHLIASLEKNTDQEDLWTETERWSENALENPQGLVDLETSENVVEEPPSNLLTEDFVQKIDLGTPDKPRPVFISKNIKHEELPK